MFGPRWQVIKYVQIKNLKPQLNKKTLQDWSMLQVRGFFFLFYLLISIINTKDQQPLVPCMSLSLFKSLVAACLSISVKCISYQNTKKKKKRVWATWQYSVIEFFQLRPTCHSAFRHACAWLMDGFLTNKTRIKSFAPFPPSGTRVKHNSITMAGLGMH